MLAIDLTGKHALVAGVGDDVGVAAFLSSPLASGITGTVIEVDKGYSAMGLTAVG